jgi:hypothetical protein
VLNVLLLPSSNGKTNYLLKNINLRYVVTLVVALPLWLSAQEVITFMFDGGVQGGYSYIIGDSGFDSYVVAGIHVRYKFDQRWSLRAQVQQHVYPESSSKWGNIDISAEYNFFQYGIDTYNLWVKEVSPFIALGVGITSTLNELKTNPISGLKRVYVPIGIGVKWKFADKWQLQATWQHQVYLMKDDLDNEGWDGSITNIMNNDMLSTFTVGLSIDFFRYRRKSTYYSQ